MARKFQPRHCREGGNPLRSCVAAPPHLDARLRGHDGTRISGDDSNGRKPIREGQFRIETGMIISVLTSVMPANAGIQAGGGATRRHGFLLSRLSIFANSDALRANFPLPHHWRERTKVRAPLSLTGTRTHGATRTSTTTNPHPHPYIDMVTRSSSPQADGQSEGWWGAAPLGIGRGGAGSVHRGTPPPPACGELRCGRVKEVGTAHDVAAQAWRSRTYPAPSALEDRGETVPSGKRTGEIS